MSGRQLVSVRGLIVPADLRRRVEVRELALLSTALSDAIGGGLLDDALHATLDGHRYVVYVDERRVELGQPVNDRAVVLSARLGLIDRTWLRDLRGDALVLGTDEHRNDEDVPRAVLDLARAAHVLPSLEPRFLPPGHPHQQHSTLDDPRHDGAATGPSPRTRRQRRRRKTDLDPWP